MGERGRKRVGERVERKSEREIERDGERKIERWNLYLNLNLFLFYNGCSLARMPLFICALKLIT